MHLELNNVSMLYRFLFGDTTILNTHADRKTTVNHTDKLELLVLKNKKQKIH